MDGSPTYGAPLTMLLPYLTSLSFHLVSASRCNTVGYHLQSIPPPSRPARHALLHCRNGFLGAANGISWGEGSTASPTSGYAQRTLYRTSIASRSSFDRSINPITFPFSPVTDVSLLSLSLCLCLSSPLPCFPFPAPYQNQASLVGDPQVSISGSSYRIDIHFFFFFRRLPFTACALFWDSPGEEANARVMCHA